jgi:hypothetical protein
MQFVRNLGRKASFLNHSVLAKPQLRCDRAERIFRGVNLKNWSNDGVRCVVIPETLRP